MKTITNFQALLQAFFTDRHKKPPGAETGGDQLAVRTQAWRKHKLLLTGGGKKAVHYRSLGHEVKS